MKKTAFAAVALVFILILACGKQTPETEPTPAPTITPEVTPETPEPTALQQTKTITSLDWSLFEPLVEIGYPKETTPLYCDFNTDSEIAYELEVNPDEFLVIVAIGIQDTQAEGWYLIDYDGDRVYAESKHIEFITDDAPTPDEQPQIVQNQPTIEDKQPVVTPQPQQPTVTPQPQQPAIEQPSSGGNYVVVPGGAVPNFGGDAPIQELTPEDEAALTDNETIIH